MSAVSVLARYFNEHVMTKLNSLGVILEHGCPAVYPVSGAVQCIQ